MEIYLMELTSTLWTELEDKLLNFVSPERQSKIYRYKYEIDRKLSLYAALITRMGLSKISGIPPEDILFSCLPNHKPKVLSLPGYDFNFSHTRNCILCCISDSCRVGADIEKITKAPFEIMKNVFHTQESQYISTGDSLEQNKRFYEIWTKKEAYLKLKGTGLIDDLYKHNTLFTMYNTFFDTWQYKEYICSICFNQNLNFQIYELSEKVIAQFFISNYE